METTFMIRLAPQASDFCGQLYAEIHADTDVLVRQMVRELIGEKFTEVERWQRHFKILRFWAEPKDLLTLADTFPEPTTARSVQHTKIALEILNDLHDKYNLADLTAMLGYRPKRKAEGARLLIERQLCAETSLAA